MGLQYQYNDFDFFYKMELPRPEIDVKWDSRTHLLNTFFGFFLAVSSDFGFNVSKKLLR